MARASKRPVLIHATYRLAGVARFAGACCAGFVVLGLSLFAVLHQRLGAGYRDDLTTLSGLQEQLPFLVALAGVIHMLVVGAVLVFLLLLWAHAVSGPLVRVRRLLSSLSGGQPMGAVRFRATDQLHGLADSLRRFNHARETQRAQWQLALDQAQHSLHASQQAPAQSPADPAQLRKACADLQRAYDAMRRLLVQSTEG